MYERKNVEEGWSFKRDPDVTTRVVRLSMFSLCEIPESHETLKN